MTVVPGLYKENDEVTGGARGTYKIVREIASGGYGAVYRIRHSEGGQQHYALKVEKRQPTRDHFKLTMELQVLEAAQKDGNITHFPELFDYCRMKDRMWVVMSLLGDSLADVKGRRPDRVLSPNTGYYVALECLKGVEGLHRLGFVHRDIKPGNFVLGRRTGKTANNRVYMVDFGIARYILDEQGSIKTPRSRTRFKGTLRYAPLATHRLEEFGRKDDIECWLYMFVDLINPRGLPWRSLTDTMEIEDMKSGACSDPSKLFNDRQEEMAKIMSYVARQHYVDKLDYDWMKNMVRRAARREGVAMTPPFDWSDG